MVHNDRMVTGQPNSGPALYTQ